MFSIKTKPIFCLSAIRPGGVLESSISFACLYRALVTNLCAGWGIAIRFPLHRRTSANSACLPQVMTISGLRFLSISAIYWSSGGSTESAVAPTLWVVFSHSSKSSIRFLRRCPDLDFASALIHDSRGHKQPANTGLHAFCRNTIVFIFAYPSRATSF